MSPGAGDKMLNDALSEAVSNLEHPSKFKVCEDHDAIRQGVYVLLLCEQDRRSRKSELDNPTYFGCIQYKQLKVSGLAVVVLAVAYCILKLHGVPIVP